MKKRNIRKCQKTILSVLLIALMLVISACGAANTEEGAFHVIEENTLASGTSSSENISSGSSSSENSPSEKGSSENGPSENGSSENISNEEEQGSTAEVVIEDGSADSESADSPDGDSADEGGESSGEDAAIVYAGEAFTKSVFAAGGNSLYVCGIRDGEYFFGYMEQEGDRFEEFSLDMDENMRAFNMYVDEENQCHILWFSTESVTVNGQELESIDYEKSCITVIDGAGNILKNIDTTEFFREEQMRPNSFVADRKGNYWFEDGAQLVSLSPEGELNEKVDCPGTVENVGIGAGGLIYAIYHEEGSRYLGNILDDGAFYREDQLPDVNSNYSYMAPGTKGVDLLIYHQSEGVYGYDRNTRKQVVKAEVLPITGEDVSGYGFLADGRLCLMSSGTDGTIMFYYIHTTGVFYSSLG
ncbi:MAG: hypothetical protein LUE16_02730 [Lachnospiraceae bacterium]|nr:hypothetical protein [Lachnospiraceae bacterium]